MASTASEKKRNAIKLANACSTENMAKIIVTGGGVANLDKDTLVETLKTKGGDDIKVEFTAV
jgi:hypothetical protein